MKLKITTILAAAFLGFAAIGCNDSTRRDAASEQESTEQSDSTYLDNQDNNGQPTSGQEGGTVTETEGAPESGYGTNGGSESDVQDDNSNTK